MNYEILQQLGLSGHQSMLYTALLTTGPQKAGALAKQTGLKRGLVYKTLEDLQALHLIEKDDQEGAVAVFHAKHPQALNELAQQKAQEITHAKKMLETELGSLISSYNLATGKPGVEFYEGIDGVAKVLEDTLTSPEEIYTYVDSGTLDQKKDFIAAEKQYVKKRLKSRIAKKILMVDSPEARNYAQEHSSEFTQIRILSEMIPAFCSAMEIYDGRVSYITFDGDIMTGTLMHSRSIYMMHRSFFDFTWSKSRGF